MRAVRRMTANMYHRGPDADGDWAGPGVALGHRRLAIQDLDTRSTQPMHSACGRYTIVFNGEIYNFRSLRDELSVAGTRFVTTSDTEVLLALFAAEGQAMLSRLRGMFAFVIWDSLLRQAFLARDPYGIKPIYWALVNDGVMIASQVKALMVTGEVSRSPCALGQAGFWMLGSVPEPYTWYADVMALPAGHFCWCTDGRMGRPERWWDIAAAWRDAPKVLPSIGEIKERTSTALSNSVAAHLVADVPVGVFLSGGIDSGSLASLMLEAGAHNLHGITIGYDEFSGTKDDEVPRACTLAKYFGICHYVRRVTRHEFISDLPRILAAMDQPTIDGINSWYAAKAVAELGLKVVVSGVGGDELFQGYSSFQQLPKLVSAWGPASRIPGATPIAEAIMDWQAHRSGNERWRHLPDWARTMAGAWWLRRSLYSPTQLSGLMGTELAAEGLRDFSPTRWLEKMCGPLASEDVLAVGQIESTTYMRNQLLRDSDWASMDHSVELRTPLVDAWLLRDLEEILSGFRFFPNKQLLADAPNKPMPVALLSGAKTGFSIPVETWLKQAGITDDGRGGRHTAWAREVARIYET